MKFRSSVAFCLSLLSYAVVAQEEPAYPTDYFRNPLEIPILLAGNFGECRPGHFHSGLDIKTEGRENLPVYAAAEGYISRIKTEKGGFGHALYITHPNGYTTLYAHLNNFIPFVQTYLRQKQYEAKRWDLDLQLNPSQFPVRKGQQIAWSGNTGGSTAPHLHFEIRNTETEHPLNPQLFGLKVQDGIAPTIRELAFYEKDFYGNSPIVVTMARKDGAYRPSKSVNSRYKLVADTLLLPTGLIGVGINADDFMEGSENTITFYKARVYLDDDLQSEVTLDDIGYDQSRYMHAYADYRTRQKTKRWIQCLFRLPGNNLNQLYTRLNEDDGRLLFASDTMIHELRVELIDNNGNRSSAFSWIKCLPAETMPAPEGCTIFRQGKVNTYKDPGISFTLDERQLYDDVCFTISAEPKPGALSQAYKVHDPSIPLHHYFDMALRPDKPIPLDMRSKVVLMYSDGGEPDGKAAAPAEQGWYKASVRNFGTYWLATDTEPPVITSVHKDNANLSRLKQITVNAKDAITSVKSFTGMIDGRWVCFEQRGSTYFYEFDEHCTKGKHHLMFRAADENGNESKFELDFTR